MRLVGVTIKTAQWIGGAAEVAGGCVAVGDAGDEAVLAMGILGRGDIDYLAVVPDHWSGPEYMPVNAEQRAAAARALSCIASGWSGAARVNLERAETRRMLGL